MTEKEAEVLIRGLAPVLRDYVAAQIAPLRQRICDLEQRPALKYAGVFQRGNHYPEGHLTTHAGSLWLATTATDQVPGDGATSWRLIAKRGEA